MRKMSKLLTRRNVRKAYETRSWDKSSSNTTYLLNFFTASIVKFYYNTFGSKSCTSGKAGGLICEPLKAVWPATPARFLFEHLQLIESTIFFLLLSDVISHLRLVPPHRRHVIAPRPKIQPNKVLRLDVPHHPGYRILRRDRQHHVNMIAHQMPFGLNTT